MAVSVFARNNPKVGNRVRSVFSAESRGAGEHAALGQVRTLERYKDLTLPPLPGKFLIVPSGGDPRKRDSIADTGC